MASYEGNKTKDFFYKVALLTYLFGLPNFWIEDFKLPKWFMRSFDIFTKIINNVLYFFILMEMIAFFTQENLSEKQKSDLLVYGISHPILYSYRVFISYKEDNLRAVLLDLVVTLKKVYNDVKVERQMIKKSLLYSSALVFSCILAMFFYTFDSILHVIRTGATFNVVITTWPKVEDRSTLANAGRIVFYILWWFFMSRVSGAYTTVICLTTCLSHQYTNLRSYFENLNNIFETNFDQAVKEQKYEDGFKVGIALHLDTLRCTRECHSICQGVFSGQIILNILLLVVLMSQMINSERTLVTAFATASSASAVLISTGYFMWNAGDVTVEASRLSSAMYLSGWHNCHGRSSITIRKLVVITMFNAQKPVILKGLGIVDLSYQSYLSIVKSSYSVLSLLY
uniref:Odorant receptor n=1 Tax=Manduca sexta TaxID=7130 RepID=A0A0P1IVT1_MANSE|nr:Olfactory receptor 26 [Manduca sexta]